MSITAIGRGSRSRVCRMLAATWLLGFVLGWAPAPALAARLADRDLDGIPDRRDKCPNRPNPPDARGAQPLVCGDGLSAALQRYVFLQSRTFEPPEGLDPALWNGSGQRRVLLHLRRGDGRLVLTAPQRDLLRDAGVRLGRYVPALTYMAMVPADPSALERIVALPFVRGISALRPEDRIAREVRRERGALVERGRDGRMMLAVELHEDAEDAAVAELFGRVGARQVVADGTERHVRVADYEAVLALAASDLVAWIDELPGALHRHDEAARAASWADVVARVQGYDGTDLRVAMFEQAPLPLPPDQHPDLTQRMIRDNCNGPIEFCPPEDQGHNLAVAGIMIGDGTSDATKVGMLPEATLSLFANAWPRTDRHIWFRYPRRAREDHEAVLINYSVGSNLNCNQIGAYRSDAKQLDTAVAESGIIVLRAVGNTRGPTGDFAKDPRDPDPEIAAEAPRHGPCEANLESLPGPVAKNDITIGNWDMTIEDIAATSAAGPAEDERLKPDLVAPGNNIDAPSYAEAADTYGYAAFAGASAATPVASGVAGQVLQAFRDGPVTRDPLEVPPSTVKAILIHTARDVGPFGPDYFTGWGRIDAAAAVRVALDHASYVHEGRLTEAQPTHSHQFDVSGTVYGFKATLVWDDPHAPSGTSHALINDLDLVVTDPSGAQTFFPLDSLLRTPFRLAEAIQGAKRCTSVLCRDDRNNVEQVLVSDPAGGALATGTWTATVTGNPLAEPPQRFSLVVTPDDCPVRIYAATTLSGPISCPYDALEPVALSIEADGVELDCAGNAISGGGANVDGFAAVYAGIRTLRDEVTVRDCTVEDFDVGIDFADNEDGEIVDGEVRRVGNAGIRMQGSRHTVDGTAISAVRRAGGAGILMIGEAHTVDGAQIAANPSGARVARGIHVRGKGSGGRLDGNSMSYATNGILVEADLVEQLDGFTISSNTMGPVGRDGIRIVGPLRSSTISGNTIEGFGPEHAAIRLRATTVADGAPVENVVSFNRIFGSGASTQTGVLLEGVSWLDPQDPSISYDGRPEGNSVFGHLVVQNVGVGVSELLGHGNRIFGNILPATSIGVQSAASTAAADDLHIFTNIVHAAPIGIAVGGRTDAHVTGNFVTLATTGVSVNLTTELPVHVGGNFVRVAGGGTAVNVFASSDVSVEGNNLGSSDPSAATGVGVVANAVTGLRVAGNVIQNVVSGIDLVATDTAAVSGNSVTNASGVGIRVAADAVEIIGNTLEQVPATGIHYLSGDGGRITGNGLSPVAPGTYGIALGAIGSVAAGTLTDLTITEQTIANFTNAVTVGDGVVSFDLTNSNLAAADRALDGAGAADLLEEKVLVTGNVFAGVNKDAYFLEPLDTSDNLWSEVEKMDILDQDGDGDGDCGTDYLFSSTDYTGQRLGVARTSVKTNQVSDDAPLTASRGVCR